MATRIDTIQRDGETIYVYDDGMEYSADRGRIVTPPTAYQITPEKSQELNRIRWDGQTEQFVNGFLAGTPGMGANSGAPEMYYAIGKKTAELMHNAKSARGYAELLNTVIKITKPDEEHAHSNGSMSPQQLDAIGRLFDVMSKAMQRSPASVIDLDSE